MNIKEVSEKIYSNNKAKGFWDEKRNIGEMLMLVTSELAEALEADRKDRHANIPAFEQHRVDYEEFEHGFKQHIKDTFEDELADAAIRIFDIAQGLGIDLEYHIEQKMIYNSTRPYKHGKKFDYRTAKIEEKEVGTKYDWEKCQDTSLNDLLSMQDSLTAKIKERQEFLKTVPEKGLIITDEETGETVTVYRPAKSSTTSVAVTLK